MDPFTGRVLAMVGGFSYDQSEFNRATQAQRQPGSSFKPFVYAAALDNGYTPSSIVLDEPISIDQGNGEIWTPQNFEGKSGGPHTLRYGVEHSINQMTVRLARDIGMPLIAEYAKRFGIYDNLPPYPVDVAGRRRDDGAAHGHRLFDVRQRRQAHQGDADRPHPGPLGQHDLPHDERICQGCDAAKWDNQDEPKIIDKREQVIDPLTAYQITSIMQGVIQRGTGIAISELQRHAGRQDRHHQRSQGSVVRRLFAEPRVRRVHGLRQAALARRQRPGRALHRADLSRLHEDGAEGQARHAVPRAAGHQADFGRRAHRHALERAGVDRGGVQARHGAARRLRRRRQRAPTSASLSPDVEKAVGAGTGGLY